MNARREPRSQIADIARQARELLGQVRESRWPGFEPPRAEANAGPSTDTPRKAAPARPIGRPAALPSQPIVRPRPASARGPARPASAPESPAAIMRGNEALPETVPWSTLEEIAKAVGSCTKCPLHATRKQTVPGEGDARARLLFVGEAPGAEEDRLGRPFVGAAGQLLDKMIRAMGFARSQVFIANVLKCRPPGNRDPQDDEVAACLPYLRAQVALIRPEAICTLGKHATQALLGRKDPLGTVRGRFFAYRGTPLMPTYHPSYLLRTPAEKGAAWKDLQGIMDLLGLPLPEQHATEEREP